MDWEGTVEGERHNKEIWRVIREMDKSGTLTQQQATLSLEFKNWLCDLDKRISRMGPAGKLPVIFIEIMLQDYADAANSRQVKEGIKRDSAFNNIRRVCEAWDIDYSRIVNQYVEA